MPEKTRRSGWNQIPKEARVAVNGPTTAVYSSSNTPNQNDPGWRTWEDATGKRVSMINIHGPFAVQGQEGERCEDGWLAIDENGTFFSVETEYFTPENKSDIEERARPFGYSEVK